MREFQMYILSFFRKKYFFSPDNFLVRKSHLFFLNILCNFESFNSKIGKTMYVCMNLFENVSQICHFFKSGVFQKNIHCLLLIYCKAGIQLIRYSVQN